MMALSMLTAGCMLVMLAPAVFGDGYGPCSHGEGTACIGKPTMDVDSFQQELMEKLNFKYLNAHLNMTTNEFLMVLFIHNKPFIAYHEGKITIEEFCARIEGTLYMTRILVADGAGRGIQNVGFSPITWIFLLAVCVLIIFFIVKLCKYGEQQISYSTGEVHKMMYRTLLIGSVPGAANAVLNKPEWQLWANKLTDAELLKMKQDSFGKNSVQSHEVVQKKMSEK
eukprot:TRINITY_DN1019_c0_g1_i11.p1 TRINITY_DN1019_c0_g1~~TRINITY_DN1019_c0_g1_i11.p1  ORF type:complete len:225 (-),score=23.84 TRINITY_DN1019_c0_g1_i11:19-693(-)